MDKDSLLDRLMDNKVKDITHSSVYARAQNERGIGTASTQSFSTRQAIEEDRKMVGRYKDSRVINEEGNKMMEAAKFDVDKEESQRAAIREKFGGEREQQFNRHSNEKESNNTDNKPLPGRSQMTPPPRRNPGISL